MIKMSFAAVAALSLAACATPSRFEWGAYENALYLYYKKPEARENYRKTLITAIERGEETKRIAPGLYAELGYLFLEDGNIADATSYFRKEMASFPESRMFLNGVVSRINGGTAATPSAPVATVAAPAGR